MKRSLAPAHRALVALVLILAAAGHAGQVNAAALPDQKKCTIFTKGDAERVLHAPVVEVKSEVDPSLCSYGLASHPSTGVLVSRETPPLYPPHPGTPSISQIRHVKGIGTDAYTYYANGGAGGVYTADVLTSKGVTSVTLSEAAGNAATALAIARTIMNR